MHVDGCRRGERVRVRSRAGTMLGPVRCRRAQGHPPSRERESHPPTQRCQMCQHPPGEGSWEAMVQECLCINALYRVDACKQQTQANRRARGRQADTATRHYKGSLLGHGGLLVTTTRWDCRRGAVPRHAHTGRTPRRPSPASSQRRTNGRQPESERALLLQGIE
jgi:hypothetical protein